MIEAKFTIAMGNYQNVKVTISGDNPSQFSDQLRLFDDSLKSRLGVFHAELESWAVKAREDALNGVTDEAVENLSHLGVTVVSEAPAAVDEAPEQEQPKRPWDRKPATAAPKAWEKKEESGSEWDF